MAKLGTTQAAYNVMGLNEPGYCSACGKRCTEETHQSEHQGCGGQWAYDGGSAGKQTESEMLKQTNEVMKQKVETEEQKLEELVHEEREKYNETAEAYAVLQKHIRENETDMSPVMILAIALCVFSVIFIILYCRESRRIIAQAAEDLENMRPSDSCPA